MLRGPFFFYNYVTLSTFVHTAQSLDGGPQRRERNVSVYLCRHDGPMPEANLDKPYVFPELQ